MKKPTPAGAVKDVSFPLFTATNDAMIITFYANYTFVVTIGRAHSGSAKWRVRCGNVEDRNASGNGVAIGVSSWTVMQPFVQQAYRAYITALIMKEC